MDISQQLNTTQEEELDSFLDLTPALVQKRRSQGRIIFDRFMRNRTAIAGGVVLIIIFLLCFLGPLFWRYDPIAINIDQIGSTYAPPSLAHPFGTDWVGRDELARAMSGGRVSLIVGLVSMFGTI